MFSVILNLLSTGLELWSSKEKTKYLDKMIELKNDWYDEFNKETPDDARLDNIEHRLLVLSESFSSQVRIENSQNK